MSNELYPVFLKVHVFDTLIVGGGKVGLEKLSFLLKSSPNAKVTLVSKSIKNQIYELAKEHSQVRLIEREFFNEDLTEMQIAIIATENHELNTQIRNEAKARGLLVNVADTPHLCDFYLGSIVSKGDLKIGISTNGKSPTIAKRLKELLNEALPNEIDEVIQNINRIRNSLKGDFNQKVTTLNELTKSLIAKGEHSGRKL